MSGNESETGLTTTAEESGFSPEPAYTLPPGRLAGSSGCLNCGTALNGPFCYHCGQPDRNFLRFFPVLLREFLEDFLDLDSRFARTLKPLLFKPGRLTRDYLEGRRFRYTPPMRLYLFSSIGFFLLAALLSNLAIDTEKLIVNGGNSVQVLADNEEELKKVEEALDQLPPDIRAQIDLNTEEQAEQDETWFDSGELQFNGEPWDRETNPLVIPFMPDRLLGWLNDEIEKSPEKGRQIAENPKLFIDEIRELLPGAMFVLLPVVALIFKFWYLFARRFYIEHLILALHNHAFIFTCLILAMMLEFAEEWFLTQGMSTGEQITIWLNVMIGVWIPIYLLLSLRHVYQQGWLLTVGKFLVIGVSYLSLLVLVTVLIVVLGFLLV